MKLEQYSMAETLYQDIKDTQDRIERLNRVTEEDRPMFQYSTANQRGVYEVRGKHAKDLLSAMLLVEQEHLNLIKAQFEAL